VRGATPVRLVILLYEQAIEDLRRALDALRGGNIEARTRALNHAILVISHLQASLDKHQGGQVAIHLERFYGQLRAGILEAQAQQSAALIESQMSQLMLVYEAWREVERSAETAAPIPQPAPTNLASEQPLFTDWKA